MPDDEASRPARTERATGAGPETELEAGQETERPAPTDPAAMMRVALDEALAALDHGDVPVGAVVVRGGRVIAARHNERELTGDPTAHAEILALRDAAAVVGHWRLDDCTVVVTLEPCAMCAGAMVNGRIGHLVYGAADPKAGAAGSCFDLVDGAVLNHRVPVLAGVLAEECGRLLTDFFAARRRRPAIELSEQRPVEPPGVSGGGAR